MHASRKTRVASEGEPYGQDGFRFPAAAPGAIHLLNGLYDAKLDHQPVLAIVGQQARAAIGGSYQQEVDLISLFRGAARDTFVVADGFSCREQIAQATDRRALHLADMLRLAIRGGARGPAGDFPERATAAVAASRSSRGSSQP